MVYERAMSVVTWLNSPKQNRQDVDTVSNHLAIRNIMDFQNAVRTWFIYKFIEVAEYRHPTARPRKLLTVNWRDLKKTICGKDGMLSTTSMSSHE